MGMGMQELTQQTLGLMADAILKGTKDGSLRKAITVGTGLVGIDLQAPAKQLVPLMSPFRQSIPRFTRPGADVTQWKVISALSSPKLSTAENAAGALFTTTVVPKSATHKVNALRGQVTREAVSVSQGFDPALAKETANTLLNYMKLEEIAILGGNVTALATPAAPTVAVVDAQGTVAAAAGGVFVRIAALTMQAINRVAIDRPADYDGTDAKLAGRAVAAVDPSADGVTVAGAETNSAATAGGNDALRISWASVPGAAGYAVYVGIAAGAANLKCECVVTQNKVTLTSLATTGALASALAGTSADALSYDGIVPQMLAAGSGSYLKDLGGKLTGSNGEILEIADMFQAIWDTAKIGKFRLLVSGIDTRVITRLGVAQNSLNIITNPMGSDGRASIIFGAHVGAILNPVTGDSVSVETLPWLPGGAIIALPLEIPYNDANASDPFDMVFSYDVERWDYASTTTTGPIYPFEIRSYGVLRAIFTGGCGMIYNVYKG